ncbi:hypothetical protein SAMN02910447_01498 [Ruminococcus sp. YE71]|uniref:ATP-binding protein n=1 Tax=unclassified Ruminococcus TaxID=2608920 RepID=UPI00088E6560|nr:MULTISPECIES: ATP-binding protein [unclassified Ruminococcus]SDA18642.1 hypothetical protein SAMN02910446_01476 [Ruminococcus sp. YE78]SFW29543.1 hypothetical protein SAMN02910447_01498 [Ruminococcus sp. YE71]
MDLEILKSMAAATGRDTFITDNSFNILWTNSKEDLTSLLVRNSRCVFNGRPTSETLVKCGPHSLRMLPLTNGDETYYLFELIDAEYATELFTKTSALGAFRDRLESSVTRYTDLAFRAAVSEQGLMTELSKQRIADSNTSALLQMLTGNTADLIIDLGEHIRHLIHNLLPSRFDSVTANCSFDITKGIVCIVNTADLDYTVINMLSNAVRHAQPKGFLATKLTVTANDEYCIMIVEDNGTAADLKRIEKFRSVYSDEAVLADDQSPFENLGITLIYTFAEKYGGYVETSLTETGGLRMAVYFKRPRQRNIVTLYSPETDEGHTETARLLVEKMLSKPSKE